MVCTEFLDSIKKNKLDNTEYKDIYIISTLVLIVNSCLVIIIHKNHRNFYIL